ncbi:IS110 family transposase [Candidatus Bipolaricaulota bacterium]|nr:IS110 family transposase [Candidatus Bipolaricaulota bacterium]
MLDRDGREVEFVGGCTDLREYIGALGPGDAVVMEASTGAFYWADEVEARGASWFILDPHKFKIIKESWNKTDRRDAGNMAKALWVHLITGEFGIPTVYKPEGVSRELRKLFAQYSLLTKQMTMHKNNIQAILAENGIVLPRTQKLRLLSPSRGMSFLCELELSGASRINLEISMQLLWRMQEAKERISDQIMLTGESLREKVRLLITIKGISPLMALAFLADVGDIRRFKTCRKMSAYLGLVPRAKNSGGRSRPGHINRESRKLTRTILTQSLPHICDASLGFRRYYDELKIRRGAGRARIAVIRKLCGIMRRMLIDGEQFRHMDVDLYRRKLGEYERTIQRITGERKTA